MRGTTGNLGGPKKKGGGKSAGSLSRSIKVSQRGEGKYNRKDQTGEASGEKNSLCLRTLLKTTKKITGTDKKRVIKNNKKKLGRKERGEVSFIVKEKDRFFMKLILRKVVGPGPV